MLMLVATVWLGIIGFVDDYLKLRAKRIAQQKGGNYKKGDKDGLAGWFKILGQVGLGIIVGATSLFQQRCKNLERISWEHLLPADTTVMTMNGKWTGQSILLKQKSRLQPFHL